MKILYFSPVRWNWIKQRPHFIAEYLASGNHDVVFCARVPWGKGAVCSRSYSISKHLEVREYAVLPFALKSGFIEKLNTEYLKRKLFREHFDVIILSDPRLIDILPDNLSARVIYECMDRYAYFYQGKVRKMIQLKEEQLCRRADAIICSSDFLKSLLAENFSFCKDKITVIRNAASDDFLQNSGKKNIPPTDLLYTGTIDTYFDWQSVISYARQHPERKIRLAGPVKTLPENLPGNIELYGKVPHSEIPALLKSASLLLIPFILNELTEAVDPVKMYEYLASGKPVLSSYWQELDYFSNNSKLHFYHNQDEFSTLAENLLKESRDSVPDQEFLAKNSWSIRGMQLSELLSTVAGSKN